jgi:predicted DNA-binding transcriptional regulator AlpA
MTEGFLYYADLVRLRLIKSRMQLSRRIKHDGFPAGRLLSRNCRGWMREEIQAYIDSRPVENTAFNPNPPKPGNAVLSGLTAKPSKPKAKAIVPRKRVLAARTHKARSS